jgi:cation transport ATPase
MSHVEQVEFTIPGLSDTAGVTDLENVLVGISGVAHIYLDAAAHRVTVEYDPDFVDPVLLKNSVKGAGYPITEPEGAR